MTVKVQSRMRPNTCSVQFGQIPTMEVCDKPALVGWWFFTVLSDLRDAGLLKDFTGDEGEGVWCRASVRGQTPSFRGVQEEGGVKNPLGTTGSVRGSVDGMRSVTAQETSQSRETQ